MQPPTLSIAPGNPTHEFVLGLNPMIEFTAERLAQCAKDGMLPLHWHFTRPALKTIWTDQITWRRWVSAAWNNSLSIDKVKTASVAYRWSLFYACLTEGGDGFWRTHRFNAKTRLPLTRAENIYAGNRVRRGRRERLQYLMM
jgi:hypothetical protein